MCKKINKYVFILSYFIFMILAYPNQPYAKSKNILKDIRMGSYKNYSRLVFDFKNAPDFDVSANRDKNIIRIGLINLGGVGKKIFSKKYNDSIIQSLSLTTSKKNVVNISIDYRNSKDAFYYFSLKNPARLIVDIKKRKQPVKTKGLKGKEMEVKDRNIKKDGFVKIYSSLKDYKPEKKQKSLKAVENLKKDKDKKKLSKDEKTISKEDEKINEDKKSMFEGGLKEELKDKKDDKIISAESESEEIVTKKETDVSTLQVASVEEKSLYKAGLKLLQDKLFEDAIDSLEAMRLEFPDGRYAEDARILIADAYFDIAKVEEDEKGFIKAISSYKEAMREYPDSLKTAYITMKIAKAYLKMNFLVEAKVTWEEILNNYKGSKFEQPARFAVAKMFLKNNNFTEGYNEFLKGIAINPTSVASRDATFLLANKLYKHQDYIISQRLYEDAMKKWPEFAELNPKILFGILRGTSFFANSGPDKAKNLLFNVVNSHTDQKVVDEALLMLGEYYHKLGDDKNSLKIYIESIARKPNSNQAVLSRLKMANVASTKPNLTSMNEIFNYDPYLKPIETYQKIADDFSGTLIAGEALFKKGEVYFNSNKYFDAVVTLKNMINEYDESPYAKRAVIYLKEILYNLIDAYYEQEGYLPILNLYHQNSDPFLKEVTKASIVYKIAESYQKAGLYDTAEKNYKKLKKLDKDRFYKKKLKIKDAELLLVRGKNYDAERILKDYLKKYSKDKDLKHIKGLYAKTLYNQDKFKQAAAIYKRLLKSEKDIGKKQEVHFYLGRSLYGMKRYKEAAINFSNVMNLYKPKNKKEKMPYLVTQSYYYNGSALYKAKKYPSALIALKLAMKKYPKDEWLIYLTGKSYEKMNRDKKANKVFSKIIKESKSIVANVADINMKDIEWYEKNKKHFKIK